LFSCRFGSLFFNIDLRLCEKKGDNFSFVHKMKELYPPAIVLFGLILNRKGVSEIESRGIPE
jgi:hypothetical protein